MSTSPSDAIYAVRCAACQVEYRHEHAHVIDLKSGDTDHRYVWIKPKVKRRRHWSDPAPCQHDGAVEAFVQVGDDGRFDWVAHEVTQ